MMTFAFVDLLVAQIAADIAVLEAHHGGPGRVPDCRVSLAIPSVAAWSRHVEPRDPAALSQIRGWFRTHPLLLREGDSLLITLSYAHDPEQQIARYRFELREGVLVPDEDMASRWAEREQASREEIW